MSTLALLLTLLTADLPADLDQLLAAAPRAEDLPGAAACYLRHERTFSIDASGRSTVELRQTILVLQEAGRRYRSLYLPWTTPQQTVTFQAARVVIGGERLVDATDLAPELLPPGRFGEVAGELRRWRLNFPYVEPGTVLDYAVSIADTRPTQPHGFSDQGTLQLAEPVQVARYTVRQPSGAPLEQQVLGPVAPPTVSQRNGLLETTWTARDLPALPNEPQRPDDARLAWSVLVSSQPSWDSIAAAYREAATPHYIATSALQQAAAGLAGAVDPARAAYELVATRVRYAFGGFESRLPGIEPRPAYETWRQRLGDCKDQATLLITLLTALGIRSQPALLRRNVSGPVAEQLPALPQFDHVVVAVPQAGGRWRWFDPTWSFGPADYLPPDIQGCRALLVPPEGSQWATLPTFPVTANLLERSAECSLAADGALAGEVNIAARGAFEQSLRYRFHGLPPAAAAREVASALAQVIDDVDFDEASLQVSPTAALATPFSLRYRFRAPSYPLRTQHLLLVLPAVLDRAELPAGLVQLPRRTPLRLVPAPERTVNRISLRLAPGLQVREVPADRERAESFAAFRVTYRLRGDTLEYQREVSWLRPEVAADEAPRVRRWYDDLRAADRQLLVLERHG
ncbi:MAG: DUF3857 domain-containing protein [Fimbriimonadaceae bacterium]|nr:DUF3857 domain-containing protein [Fimbriimonadaceae bacterium]